MITYNSSPKALNSHRRRVLLQAAQAAVAQHAAPACLTHRTSKSLMAITSDDLDHMARLACLELSPEYTQDARASLRNALVAMRPMLAVSTQGISPMSRGGSAPVASALRSDQAQATATTPERDQLMANAPARADGLFLVPVVLD